MSLRRKQITQMFMAFTAIAVFQCCCCFFPVRWRMRPPRFSNDMLQQIETTPAWLAEENLRINALPRGSRLLNSPDGGQSWIDRSGTAKTCRGPAADRLQAGLSLSD